MILAGLAFTVVQAGCDMMRPTEPPVGPAFSQTGSEERIDGALVREVRDLAAARGIGALPAKPPIRKSLVQLGQALAFDRILSGNRDISCMTCHPPAFATGDGKSLSIGQGGSGLGPARSHPQGVFIPRNAPSLFNLSACAIVLGWPCRSDSNGQFHTPAGAQLTPDMTRVFEFGAISALALFPVTNREEMRIQRQRAGRDSR
jgi:cytochrome c peroxidase